MFLFPAQITCEWVCLCARLVQMTTAAASSGVEGLLPIDSWKGILLKKNSQSQISLETTFNIFGIFDINKVVISH